MSEEVQYLHWPHYTIVSNTLFYSYKLVQFVKQYLEIVLYSLISKLLTLKNNFIMSALFRRTVSSHQVKLGQQQ